jgi:hypothetical protein
MENADAWSDCPPGTLTRAARRGRDGQLLRLALKTGAIALVVIGISFGSWMGNVWWQQRGFQLNGLTCADVRELLPAYRKGTLDERRREMLRGHVARCSICAEFRAEVLGTPAKQAGPAARFRQPYLAIAGSRGASPD